MTERADAESNTADGEPRLSGRAKTGLLIAALGVVVPGVLNNVLTQAGAPGLAVFVWTIGFGSAVVALWYVLLRPLDIGAETEG